VLGCWDDLVPIPGLWLCRGDESGDIVEADSAEEAAEQWCDWVDETELTETQWDDVQVVPMVFDRAGDVVKLDDKLKIITITTDPSEPTCPAHDEYVDSLGPEHIWENAGVSGHGGGVINDYRCSRCGLVRHEDTYAQRPDTGEQGLSSISYEEAEE
jgi:hypothetical protein